MKKKQYFLALKIIFSVCLITITFSEQTFAQSYNIKNDSFWDTKDGEPIYSQGGGIFKFPDPETGEEKWIDTGSEYVRSQYQQSFFDMTAYCKTVFTKAGCDLLHIRTDEDYVKVLQRFFIGRNR